MRCRTESRPGSIAVLAGVLSSWALAGCAFDNGEPWGRAEVGLVLSFHPSAGRWTEEGRLKTSGDYAIELEALDLRVDALSLVLGPGGAAVSAGFDPANPPEGYGLCHSGHCHADDGRLVPYEEIVAEMGLATGETTRLDVATASPGVFDVLAGEAVVAFGTCPDECRLEEGALARVEAGLTGVAVRGRVFDRRTGDNRRLPAEGVPFQGDLEGEVVLKAAASGEVGPGEPLGLRVAATLDLTDRLFDGIDFAEGTRPGGDGTMDLATVPGAEEAVLATVQENSVLEVRVSRF